MRYAAFANCQLPTFIKRALHAGYSYWIPSTQHPAPGTQHLLPAFFPITFTPLINVNKLVSNPVPDIEFLWFPVITLAVIFGGYNTVIHARRGDIRDFFDALGFLVLGAVAGAAAGAGWSSGIAGITSSGPLAQIVGWILIGGKAVNAITTAAGFIGNPYNSLKIMMGKAYTDENRSFPAGIWQAISRFTWEGLQTWSGYNYSQLRNTLGKAGKVKYFGGATFAVDENGARLNGWRGVSMGNYINVRIPGKLDEAYPGGWIYSEEGLFWHEYGHTFDSQLFGLSYLFLVGGPSAMKAQWTELRANNRAWEYAKKHMYMDEWMYTGEFPLK